MKVGVYIEETEPERGGAGTLLKTILSELIQVEKCKRDYEFVFMYPGGSVNKRQTKIEGFQAINIDYRVHFYQKIIKRINKLWMLDIGTSPIDAIIEKEKIDIVWFVNPCYQQISYPYIFTVWDLGHRTTVSFPEVSTHHEWWNRERMYSLMIPKASWILTGNENGKEEILANYNIAAEKIRIAPFPVSSFCKEEEENPPFQIAEDFYFYPAQFWPHKNHITILYALKLLKEKYNYIPTVYFTGADKGNQEYIKKSIERMGLSKQVFLTGFLSSKQMRYLYTHATAMIFASLMGPNNLPPIEAAYLGCPVIISDLPGHKEQLGEAALYFNGTDEEELAERIMDIRNKELRKTIVNKEQKISEQQKNLYYIDAVFTVLETYRKIRRCWE